MTYDVQVPGVHDFDFFWGTWHIANRRLRSRLTERDDWEEFEATGTCKPILAGSGNVDDFIPLEGSEWFGFEAGSVRLFDPETERWSIFWFDNVVHRLFPPVHGQFTGGVGEFFGDDEEAGQRVKVRYRWSGITTTSARWEQAFSVDDGATWETNWIMEFTRIAEYQDASRTS